MERTEKRADGRKYLTAEFDLEYLDEQIAARYLEKYVVKDGTAEADIFDCEFLFEEYKAVSQKEEVLSFLRDVMAAKVLKEELHLYDEDALTEELRKDETARLPFTQITLSFSQQAAKPYSMMKELDSRERGRFLSNALRKYSVSLYDENYVRMAAETWLNKLHKAEATNKGKFKELLSLQRENGKVRIAKEKDFGVQTTEDIARLIASGMLGDFTYDMY